MELTNPLIERISSVSSIGNSYKQYKSVAPLEYDPVVGIINIQPETTREGFYGSGDNFKPDTPSNDVLAAFCLMLAMSAICNFDHGAIPAVLTEIRQEISMGYIGQSLLGSFVYLGIMVGTLVAGPSFPYLSAKWTLIISLTCLSGCMYMFSILKELGSMYLTRLLAGFVQAFPAVYLPVWVDSFAPKGSAAKWIAYSQIATIGGAVAGFTAGGIISRWKDISFSITDSAPWVSPWRSPFAAQSVLLVPIIVALIFLRHDAIDFNHSDVPTDGSNHYQAYKTNELTYLDDRDANSRLNHEADHSQTSEPNKYLGIIAQTQRNILALYYNKLYVIMTLSLSVLYFVVTGIQFWITDYLIIVLHVGTTTVVALSTICFLTAPTMGLWLGGYACEITGGYKTNSRKQTIQATTLFAGLATFLSIIATQIHNPYLFASAIWFTLFFGAATVPIAIGLLMACVPASQRTLSSGLSQFTYNLLGWFAAPLLSGVVMDIISWQPYVTQETPIRVGFHFILYSSSIGFILLLGANCMEHKEWHQFTQDECIINDIHTIA